MSLAAKCVIREFGGIPLIATSPNLDLIKGQKYLITCWVEDSFGITVVLPNRIAKLRMPANSGYIDITGAFVASRTIDFILTFNDTDQLKVGKKMSCSLFIDGSLDLSLKMAFILPEILTVRDPSV